MSKRNKLRLRAALAAARRPLAITTLILSLSANSYAAPRTWIGGNADWDATNANWTNNDEPDPDDEAIFNTPNTVDLANGSEEIAALTMSGGISLDTNSNDLEVNGLVQLTDNGTDLTVRGAGSTLTAESITLNTDADLIIDNGTVTVIDPGGAGLLDINAGTTLFGRGSLHFNDLVAAGTTLLVNDGTLSASSVGLILLGSPPAGTLTIEVADDTDARIDLDGGTGNGEVNAFRNQTLVINATLSDTFSGEMNLFQNSTINIRDPWTLGSGTINVDNGLVDLAFPLQDIPAGVGHIGGGMLTQTGGAINVVDNDGTLQFDAPFTQDGGTVTNNGLVVFNADATIGAGANFSMPTDNSSITVNSNVTVTVNQANFNADGNGLTTNVITVNSGGRLDLNLGAGADENLDGVTTLNGGEIDVTTADGVWTVNGGTLNMNNTSGTSAIVDGNSVEIGNDAGVEDSNVNVGGTGLSLFDTPVTFFSDADVNVAAGAILRTGTTTFNSENGSENAEFTGNGTWQLAGTNTINEATTINMVGGTVDLDNSANILVIGGNDTHVNDDLTINAAVMASYGKSGFVGSAEINIADSATLTVNLDDPNMEWTVNSAGIINYNGTVIVDTFLAGSDVNLEGTLNVTGDGQSNARMDVSGTINAQTAGQPFRLGGGSLADPNRLIGGTVNGPGPLGAGNGKALHGFGTINSTVDFDSNAELLADDGTLTVTNVVTDVGTIGTADTDGRLRMVLPWNTSQADVVRMQGGLIYGADINNDLAGGIDGFGEISADVDNDTRIDASDGTLILSSNNNDYDGSTETGVLHAGPGAVLEVHDNASQAFDGTVQADSAAMVFSNGFELNFEPASTLRLARGRYRSTHNIIMRGTIDVAGGPSIITGPNMRFIAGSNTNLGGDLRLANGLSVVEVGANFAGGGTLINDNGSAITLNDGVNLPVLLENQGTLELGVGNAFQATGLSLQQEATGSLEIDLGGTGLNDFDILTLTGQAQLDGQLNVALVGGFNPVLGDTFTILSAVGGVSGTFASFLAPALNPGLVMNVIYNPNSVMLEIAEQNVLMCDINGDGSADAADAGLMFGNWGGAGIGDCTGDGVVDAADAGLLFSEWTGDAVPTAASVPEPAGLTLILVVGALLAGRVRQRT